MSGQRYVHIKQMVMVFLIFKVLIALLCFSSLVDLGLFGRQARAQSDQAQNPGEPEAIPAINASSEAAVPAVNNGQDLLQELRALEQKRKSVKAEQEILKAQQAQLENIKQEIEAKIEELAASHSKLESLLAQKEAVESEQARRQRAQEEAQIKQLVKIYTSMKPKTAAALIDKLDMDVVLRIFGRMKGEQIGSILSYVDMNRAALISKRLLPQNR